MVESPMPLAQTIVRLKSALDFCEKRGGGCEEARPFREALMVMEDLRTVREGAKKSPSAAATTGGQKEIWN